MNNNIFFPTKKIRKNQALSKFLEFSLKDPKLKFMKNETEVIINKII